MCDLTPPVIASAVPNGSTTRSIRFGYPPSYPTKLPRYVLSVVRAPRKNRPTVPLQTRSVGLQSVDIRLTYGDWREGRSAMESQSEVRLRIHHVRLTVADCR